MSYGKLRRLLSKEFRDIHDTILIESPFIETTRKGKFLYAAQLALTPNELVIAQEPANRNLQNSTFKESDLNLQYLYPVELVQINVFKRSQRQSLKFCIGSGRIRYFELAAVKKRKIFWELWCYHAARLHDASKLQSYTVSERHKDCTINEGKTTRMKWHDKYLYLGCQREKEDTVRPIPIPGLGPTEDIKVLYLKQKYFGCFDQSEHWVQCGSSGSTVFNFYKGSTGSMTCHDS